MSQYFYLKSCRYLEFFAICPVLVIALQQAQKEGGKSFLSDDKSRLARGDCLSIRAIHHPHRHKLAISTQ
jgi:hypothetical protein